MKAPTLSYENDSLEPKRQHRLIQSTPQNEFQVLSLHELQEKASRVTHEASNGQFYHHQISLKSHENSSCNVPDQESVEMETLPFQSKNGQ